jgi:hypothetical protein
MSTLLRTWARAAYSNIPIVVFVLLTASIFSWAQPLRDANPSDILVLQKGQEYTITSADDKSIIPDSVYYEAIFRQILTLRPSYISDADWELINGLPSHLDSQFTARTHLAFLEMCAKLDNIRSDGDVIDIASEFNDIQESHYALIDERYKQFIPKLSAISQAQILSTKTNYMEGNQFSFSKMDMGGLAAESPSVAKVLLTSGCGAIERIGEVESKAEVHLMSDERIPALPMFETKK